MKQEHRDRLERIAYEIMVRCYPVISLLLALLSIPALFFHAAVRQLDKLRRCDCGAMPEREFHPVSEPACSIGPHNAVTCRSCWTSTGKWEPWSVAKSRWNRKVGLVKLREAA